MSLIGLVCWFLMLEIMQFWQEPQKWSSVLLRALFLAFLVLTDHITGDTGLEYLLERLLLDFPFPGAIEPSF